MHHEHGLTTLASRNTFEQCWLPRHNHMNEGREWFSILRHKISLRSERQGANQNLTLQVYAAIRIRQKIFMTELVKTVKPWRAHTSSSGWSVHLPSSWKVRLSVDFLDFFWYWKLTQDLVFASPALCYWATSSAQFMQFLKRIPHCNNLDLSIKINTYKNSRFKILIDKIVKTSIFML